MNFFKTNIRRLHDFLQFLKLFRIRNHLFIVKNRNIIARIEQDNVYNEFTEKYADMIQCGAKITKKSQASNKIWICWFQGEDNAPPLVKACINSMRKNFPHKEIVILSNDNISQYVVFPEYIQKKYEEGKISHAHYSDLLRIQLLCQYGGIWADATVLCTSDDIPDSITNAPLFLYQNIDLKRMDIEPIVCSSWFISSHSNQPILVLTRDLLFEYWKTHDKAENYFIFHIFFTISTRRYADDWKMVPVFNNQSPHTLQFELGDKFSQDRWNDIMKISKFHKLNHHNDYTKSKNTFYWYIIKTYLS